MTATWLRQADPGFVAVIGPPAAGKSTLSAALADHVGARVFRLREFAHEYRRAVRVSDHLLATTDPLGWFRDDAVAFLLRAAFLRGRFPAQGLVVLENFPGSTAQVAMVHQIAAARRVPAAVIEMTAPDHVVISRADSRTVCARCEPDPRGDPHRPAAAAPHHPGECGRCGGQLAPRRGDTPPIFTARLQRFRRRIGAIRSEAAARRLPYHRVDATSDPGTCLRRVIAALADTDTLTPPLATRRRRA